VGGPARAAFLCPWRYEAEELELEPVGGVPDGAPPAGGALCVPEPLPMLGQLRVEPEPELELDPLEPELELDPELDEPLLVLPDPVFPVLDPEDGVVVEEPEPDELEVEFDPVPVFPVLEVVAALATSAPPATRPVVSAPTASTLRGRMCISCCPFHFVCCPSPFGPVPHTMRPLPVASRRASVAWWWSCPTIR
jgi:hypothetical protein